MGTYIGIDGYRRGWVAVYIDEAVVIILDILAVSMICSPCPTRAQ